MIIYDGVEPQAYEIKSGATFQSSHLNGLNKWAALYGAEPSALHVIYGGTMGITTANGQLMTIDDIEETL